MKKSSPFRYNAFISYSHAADGKLAPSLQSALHKLAKPLFKIRALNVFRDQTNLSATPHLWSNIEEALSDSEYFILMASPESASSKWVNKEIEYWLKNRSAEKLLLVLSEGDISWDEKLNDFDWEKTTAIPKTLSKAYEMEPLFVDFRGVRTETAFSMRNQVFKEKAGILAATLHHKQVNEFVGLEIQEHKKTSRIRSSAIILFLLLIAGAVYFAINAAKQQSAAESNLAVSYIEKAKKSEQEGFYDLTSFYGAAALSQNDDRLETKIYANELHRIPKIKTVSDTLCSGVKSVTYLNNDKIVAAFLENGNISFFDAVTLKELNTFSEKDITAFSLSKDKGKVVLGYSNGEVKIGEVEIDANAVHFKNIYNLCKVDNTIELLDLSYDNQYLAIGAADLFIMDITKNELHKYVTNKSRESAYSNFILTAIKFSNRGHMLALGDQAGYLTGWELFSSEDPFGATIDMFCGTGDLFGPFITALSFSPSDDILVTSTSLWGELGYYALGGHGGYDRLPITRNAAFIDVVYDPNEKYIVGASYLPKSIDDDTGYGGLEFYDVDSQEVDKILTHYGDAFSTLAMSQNGRYLITGTDNGKLILWKLTNCKELLNTLKEEKKISKAQLFANNKYLLKKYEDNSIEISTYPETNSVLFVRDNMVASSLSQNENYFVSIQNNGNKQKIEVLDTETYKIYSEMYTDTFNIKSLSVSNDGNYVTYIRYNGEIANEVFLANPNNSTEEKIGIPLLKDEYFIDAGFSIKGNKHILATSNRIVITGIKSLQMETEFTGYVKPGGSDNDGQLVFSDNGNDLIFICGGEVAMCKLNSGYQYSIISVEASSALFIRGDYFAVLSEKLNFYSLDDISNKAENLDLGLANSDSYNIALDTEQSLLTTISTDQNYLYVYDISNITNSLDLEVKDGKRLMEKFEKKYNLQFKDGNIVRINAEISSK